MHPTLGSAADIDGVVEADFGPIAVGDVDADWSGREVTTADLVSWLCAHAGARRVVLRGARVHSGDDTAGLNLTDLQAQTALILRHCRIDELVDLSGTVIGRLEIHDCHLKKALRLEYAGVRGGLTIHGADTRLHGTLRLEGATIGGQLAVYGGARVAADADDRAVLADGLKVDSSVVIAGADTRLEGALRLTGATIGGQLAVGDGARVAADADGRAIDADNMKVHQGLHIMGAGTRLEGALRLTGAAIGGILAVRGGAQILAGTDGRAIDADGLKVDSSVVIEGADTRLEGALRLIGATIGGQLAAGDGARVAADADGRAIDADKMKVHQGLHIMGAGTGLEGALRLTGATIGGQLAVHGGARVAADADGRAIDADSLKVDSVVIEGAGTRLEGALRLTGATIGGQLAVGDGARVAADADGRAVLADGLKVDQHLFIEGAGTRLEGALHLTGATIGGYFFVHDGARVAAGTDGRAIAANRLKVDQSVYINGVNTRLGGALRLVGATIGGAMVVGDGVQMAADADGRAIDADSLKVDQNLSIADADTRLGGALRLVGATVGGHLSVRDGAGVDGDLDLKGSDVATLTVERSGRVGGAVDLSSARVRRLMDAPSGWAQVAGGWRLSGVTIEALHGTLHGTGNWTVDERIEWLRRDLKRSRRPFTQVAGLYRQGGHSVEARRIAMAGEAATSSWWRRFWLGATVGYGYQPLRAALIAVVLVVLAWAATSGLGGPGLFIPTDTEDGAACPVDYPCLDRLVYTVETVLPVVAFGQRDAWRVDTWAPYGQQVQVGQYVLDAAGWVLALLVVGAVSGAVRRD